jgi:hypothetical protein
MDTTDFKITLKHFTLIFFGLFMLFGVGICNAIAKLTIIVNPGPFATVKEATISEKK